MKLLKNHRLLSIALLGFLVVTPGIAFAGILEETMWNLVIGIFGRILALCAILLNYGINEFVIGFADNYATSGIGVAIDETWVLVRDVMNLAFIFGLVYIGFKIILDSDDSRTRSMLANLVIAALLINFSLFITKFTIDIANSFAAEIAVNGFQGTDKPVQFTNENGQSETVMRYEVDMAGDLMNRMGINSIYGDGKPPAGAAWGYIFGTALLFIITSFVFAAGGMLLAVRFVALNLYMVMSPFMFIGWALPPLAKYTTQYWSGFLKRCFFAPIYFLLMYFSLHILNGLSQSRNLADSQASFRNTFAAEGIQAVNATQSTIPFFVVACIFMLASIVVANKMGADGASQAINLGQNLRRKAQNGLKHGAGAVTFGLGARAGQRTIGAGADRLAKSSRFQSFASNNKLGEYMYRGTKATANASFDGRKVGGMGKSLGLGAGMKGGYADRKKESEKAAVEFNDMLKADMSTTQNKKRVQSIKDELANEKLAIDGKDTHALSSDDQLNKDIKALDSRLEILNETLQNKKADGQLTSGEEAKLQKEIDEKEDDRNSRKAVLDDRTEIKSLRDAGLEAASEAMIAESNGDTRLATEYRQKAENFDKKLQDKKNYEARNKALEEKSQDKKFAENQVEFRNQAKYQQSLASAAARFDPFDDFSVEKLAAIQKKSGGDEVVKSFKQIQAEFKRTMGPNGASSRKELKEAFADALEENRLETAKAIAKKSRTTGSQKNKMAMLSEVLKENNVLPDASLGSSDDAK